MQFKTIKPNPITIKCDNPDCRYLDKQACEFDPKALREWVNRRCPCCGENLLTRADYRSFRVIYEITVLVECFGRLLLVLGRTKLTKQPTSVLQVKSDTRGGITINPHHGSE